MEKNVRMAILFDQYGAMLTDKQREYVDLYYNENLTLSEIGENDSISRQAVRDALLRAEASLEEMEAKIGVIRQQQELNEKLSAIQRDVGEIARLNSQRFKNGRLLELCNSLDDKLEQLKH